MTGLFQNRISSLGFIALLLMSSAVVRVSTNGHALVAFAEEGLPLGESVDPPQLDIDHDNPLSLASMVEELQMRNKEITEREIKVEERVALLELMKQRIEDQLVELNNAEKKLTALLALSSTAAEDDLSRLTAVYETMKPKEAAPLFEEMPPEFAAGFLSRMRSDAAAAILAGLDPATAYSISVVMAGRNANALTE